MQNFTYRNPVEIVFGKGVITELSRLVPWSGKVLMTYGGGSIKRNGVYAQVCEALNGRDVIEFGGIESNPRYETLMRGVELARRESVDFVLAVGGGSVLDGSKFIAAAVPFEGVDPWDLVVHKAQLRAALPWGCVLTLPATGSEMNMFAVISRDSTQEKRAFGTPLIYPAFSILDPETTYSLPDQQTRNGIVDAFTHVMEQYATYDAGAPLQERQAEAILKTLVETGPAVLRDQCNYDLRATIMWCATHALNGVIGLGVPQDWTTHMIGHELTAVYGLDHGQTLAIVLPGVLTYQRLRKQKRLAQYAARVWGIERGEEPERAEAAIARTEGFFRSLGIRTRLGDCGVPRDSVEIIARRFEKRERLGEHGALGSEDVRAILALRA
jgi:NADP-dependent alcohol dehydrogenase